MRIFITIVIALISINSFAVIRTVSPPLEQLPAHGIPPTRAEIIEKSALRAARAERANALAELSSVVGSGCMTNSVTISNEVAQIRAKAAALREFGNVISDTRTNIVETAELSDVDIAHLYLRQTQKTSRELEAIAPTNSLEYLIGAGIRADLNNKNKGE